MSLVKKDKHQLKNRNSIEISGGIESYFYNIKEDNKPPKFNFMTGILAGMIITKIAMIKGFDGSISKAMQDFTKHLVKETIEQCKLLIEKYHWKKDHIMTLYKNYFTKEDV